MMDWSRPDAEAHYRRAGDAYKEYIAASRKQNHKRYVSFDMAKKVMCLTAAMPPYAGETHPVGALLLAFANLDLTEYEREWQHTLSLIRDPATYYYEVGCYIGLMGASGGVLKDAQEEDPADLEYNRRVCVDRFVRRFQGLHPYLAVFDSDYVTLQGHDAASVLQNELNLVKLREEAIRYIELCLNEQTNAPYAKLTPVQRYALHARTAARMPVFSHQSTLYFRAVSGPDTKARRKMARFETTEEDLHRVAKAQSFDDVAEYPRPDAVTVAKTAASEYVVEEGYAVQTARGMAMLELSRMIMAGVRVRMCGYCGCYFVPRGKHDTKYCANILEGRTQSCQALGATRDFAKKMRQETAYHDYRLVYKRMNQRMHKDMITPKAFKQWQGNAQLQLERCNSGEISLTEFRTWIKA